jgi:hypothetical protein
VSSSTLVALTHIPYNAPVRPKMLFASTRSTLVRELGIEKFPLTVFTTEEDEILGKNAWLERSGELAGGVKREDMMSEKERGLEAVRKAEAEARSGTPHRDIGIGGTFGPGSGSGMRVSMDVDDAAKTAVRELQDGGLVQLVWIIPSPILLYGLRSIWICADARGRMCVFGANIWFLYRRLMDPLKVSNSSMPRPVSTRARSPPTSPRLRPVIPSITTPGRMLWCSCTPAPPDRQSKSVCCTPAHGELQSRLPRMRVSRS